MGLSRKEILKSIALVCVVTLFISCGSSSAIAPIFELLLDVGCDKYACGDVNSEDYDIRFDKAKSYANHHLTWFLLASYLPQVLGIATVGHLADLYGRRFALCLSGGAMALTNLLAAVIPPEDFYTVLVPLCVVINFTGGFISALGTLFACIADVTTSSTDADRHTYFAVSEAVVFFGLLIGPTVAGMIVSHYGARDTLYFPFCCNTISVILAAFTLPQSTQSTTGKFSWSKTNPFASIYDYLKRDRIAPLLGVIMTLTLMGSALLTSATPIWLKTVHDYDAQQIGYMQSEVYGVNALGLLVVSPMAERIGIKPKWTIMLAAVSLIVWPIVWAIDIVNPYVAALLSTLTSLIFPVARTSVAAMYKPSEYGTALAVVATFQTAATCVGFLAAPALIQEIGWKLTFYIAAGLSVIGAICIFPLSNDVRPVRAPVIPVRLRSRSSKRISQEVASEANPDTARDPLKDSLLGSSS